MTQAPETALLQLLEEEHRILLSGDLSALTDTTARKLDLAQAVSSRAARIPTAQMAALSGAAHRNAELFEAARQGIRRAIDRIAERARAATSLETYDRQGRRLVHENGAGRLEKRS
jgi:hypothetical protein